LPCFIKKKQSSEKKTNRKDTDHEEHLKKIHGLKTRLKLDTIQNFFFGTQDTRKDSRRIPGCHFALLLRITFRGK